MDLLSLAFLLYIGVIAIISLGAALSRGGQELVLGGRRVHWLVTAISAHAADMSDWLFMALPAAIYQKGAIEIPIALGLVFGMWLVWQFLATKLRQETEKTGANTLVSYFEISYHDTQGIISILSAIIMIFFFTIYLAAGIKGVVYVLGNVFGISDVTAALLTIGVTLMTLLFGGFIAASWVDFFQGIFLLGSIVLTAVFGYQAVGGWQAISAAAHAQGLSLNPFSGHSILQIIVGPFAWGLGYFGMPHILSKFMGASDAEKLYKSKYIGLSWQVVALASAVCIGLIAIPFFSNGLVNPEKDLFINMTLQLFPTFIAGLIFCGILSATLSTMNSQMHVLASVFANDIYAKKMNPAATQKAIAFAFRGAVIVCVSIAFILALWHNTTIFSLVQFAWAGLGAAFGPLTLFTVYKYPVTRLAARLSIVLGAAASILWKLYGITIAGLAINEIVPGFIVGCATLLLLSCRPRPTKI